MPYSFCDPVRILAAGAAAILLAACPGKQDDAKAKPAGPPPVAAQTALAVRKDIPVDLRAIGNVEPIASVAIKAQVAGELIDVSFTEGQDVKKGQLLFTIQPKLYATQLAQAKANLARDSATAVGAVREKERQEELDAKGAGIKGDLDKARAQAAAAEATVKADEALVLIADTQLGYTTIESPIDGRTGAIKVRPGNLIKAAADDALTTVVQLAPIYVAFSVPEQYLASIRKGMAERKIEVTAHDPRNGKKLGDGKLTFIENTVDATTGTILLKATFDNDDRALWPGTFVDVVLHLDTDKGVVVVPAAAVTIGQRGTQIYVVKPDNSADLRTVKTGRTVNQETVILEGVDEKEKVVTLGQAQMLPGSKVVEKAAPGTGSDKADKAEKGVPVDKAKAASQAETESKPTAPKGPGA